MIICLIGQYIKKLSFYPEPDVYSRNKITSKYIYLTMQQNLT